MSRAKEMDLRDMLDETARMLREYESEERTVQSFGYEVNQSKLSHAQHDEILGQTLL